MSGTHSNSLVLIVLLPLLVCVCVCVCLCACTCVCVFLSSIYLNFNICVYGGGFPNKKQCFNTSWVFCSSSQFWYCVPGDTVRSQGWGLHSLRVSPLPPPEMLVESPGYHLSSWGLAFYRPEISVTLSLGSINLLVWLTKLRNILLTSFL